MKIVVETMFSAKIVFFVNEDPKDCMKLLRKENRFDDVALVFQEQNPENGLVTWHENDFRLQFCYLGKADMASPFFHNKISHEVYHLVNNIVKMTGMQDDGEGNEHIAYLIGHITEHLYAGMFGMYKKRLDA